MKNTKTIMLIASIALVAVIFANVIANVFFPAKPDEPVLFTISIENRSGTDIKAFGISYGPSGQYITTEYVGHAGKNIKNGEVFDIHFYESILGTSSPENFIFSVDINTFGDNFFCAAEDITKNPENGKTYSYILEKTPEGFILKEG